MAGTASAVTPNVSHNVVIEPTVSNYSVSEYRSYLAIEDPETLKQFDALTSYEQVRFVELLSDPTVIQAMLSPEQNLSLPEGVVITTSGDSLERIVAPEGRALT